MTLVKILIPTADFPPIEGGISTVALHLSRKLAQLGHDVTVVAPYFPGQKDFDAAEPASVLRFRGYGLGWFRLFPMWAACRRLLAEADMIVAINISYGGAIGYWAYHRHRRRYCVISYAYEFLKFEDTPVYARLLRILYSKAAPVVAISQFTRQQLMNFGVEEDNIAVILPGAEPAPTPSESSVRAARTSLGLHAGRIILSVGRLVPRKGHAKLIQAMPEVIAKFPDMRLVVVGQGPCEQLLKAEVTRLGIADSVVFAGRTSDDSLAVLYSICEFLVLPSSDGPRGQVEGFGLVFAEAAAYGRPVIAGRSGGVTDAVLDTITGIVIDASEPSAIATAMLHLLEHPEVARQMGDAGKARVEQELNWDRFTTQLLAEWERRA